MKGGDDLIKKLDALGGSAFEDDLVTTVNDCIGLVQATAKDLCPAHRGELENSIHTMTGREDSGVVIASCYTNKEYAPYVEFGTGPVGQADHADIAPDIPVTYSQKGWMIPGKAMTRYEAEEYGLGVVEDKDGEPIGYLTNGQPARPYMYPALRDNADEIVKRLGETVRLSLEWIREER